MAEWVRPGNYLIFNTIQEAKDWLGKVGIEQPIIPVKGIVKTMSQPCSIWGYARNIKVWQELK